MKPTENLKPIPGSLVSAFEIEDPYNEGEYIVYHIAHNKDYISLGGICNIGLLVDFYFKKDVDISLEQQLQEIYEVVTEAIYNKEQLKGEVEV